MAKRQYKNKMGGITQEYDQFPGLRANMSMDLDSIKYNDGTVLRSATKSDEGKTSQYQSNRMKTDYIFGDEKNGYLTDVAAAGTVRNNKSLKEAKAQLKRIEAMSDGSKRHQRLVERARSTVQALSDYKALGRTAG